MYNFDNTKINKSIYFQQDKSYKITPFHCISDLQVGVSLMSPDKDMAYGIKMKMCSSHFANTEDIVELYGQDE